MSYLEILDTAVKIGLGAAISGVAMYFITRSRGEHEIRKEVLGHKRNLIERITLAFQESANEITWVVHLTTRALDMEEEGKCKILSQVQDRYLGVFQNMNTAEGLAYLLGDSDLNRLLKDYGDAVLELYHILCDPKLDRSAIDTTIVKLNDLRHGMPKVIANTYKKALYS